MNKLWKTTQNQQRAKVLQVHTHVNNHQFNNMNPIRETVP
jgi:hypothetical protein